MKARLSLERAVQEALASNAQLQAARFEPQAAQADRITAGLRPNPTLTLNGDILPSQGLGPAQKSYGLSVVFPLELGGKRDARLRLAETSIIASDKQLQDQERLTVGAVRMAYCDFLGSSERAIVSQRNLELLDSLVALSKVRVTYNDIAQVELTRSQVERDKVALDVERIQEDYRAARTSLLMLIGRSEQDASSRDTAYVPDPAVHQLIAEYVSQELPPLDSVLAVAAKERPDIQTLVAEEEEAEANLELQRSLAKIDMNVSVDFSRQQGVTFYGSTLSIPLPIYNQNQGELEKATVRVEQARVRTAAARAQLQAEVTNAWFDAQTHQRSLRTLSERVLHNAGDVRAAIEYSYKRGGTSLVDFLDAARTYNELELAYVDAFQSYAKSLVTLNLVTGKDLFYAKS